MGYLYLVVYQIPSHLMSIIGNASTQDGPKSLVFLLVEFSQNSLMPKNHEAESTELLGFI